MNKSGTGLQHRSSGKIQSTNSPPPAAESPNYSLTLRAMKENHLEGLEAFRDGISFRSERPIAMSQNLELVLCDTILIEVEVMACQRASSAEGGWLVHARYRKTSPDLRLLITEELHRMFHSTP